MQSTLSKATLGRLPMYLQFIRRMDAEKVSATQIAKGLGLGEVQVRKDLASVCTAGLPKVGYPVSILRRDMEKALGVDVPVPAVIVGAGKLGTALMDYDGFSDYGVDIAAAWKSPPLLTAVRQFLRFMAMCLFIPWISLTHFAPCIRYRRAS